LNAECIFIQLKHKTKDSLNFLLQNFV